MQSEFGNIFLVCVSPCCRVLINAQTPVKRFSDLNFEAYKLISLHTTLLPKSECFFKCFCFILLKAGVGFHPKVYNFKSDHQTYTSPLTLQTHYIG